MLVLALIVGPIHVVRCSIRLIDVCDNEETGEHELTSTLYVHTTVYYYCRYMWYLNITLVPIVVYMYMCYDLEFYNVTHSTHTHIYIYAYVCVCVCMCQVLRTLNNKYNRTINNKP